MAWWHGDMVTSKEKLPKISKSCQGLPKNGWNWHWHWYWQKLPKSGNSGLKWQKNNKSSQKFVRAAKSCQKDTKICPEMLKVAINCQNWPNLSTAAKIWQKVAQSCQIPFFSLVATLSWRFAQNLEVELLFVTSQWHFLIFTIWNW